MADLVQGEHQQTSRKRLHSGDQTQMWNLIQLASASFVGESYCLLDSLRGGTQKMSAMTWPLEWQFLEGDGDE